jgi:hypothetical protein
MQRCYLRNIEFDWLKSNGQYFSNENKCTTIMQAFNMRLLNVFLSLCHSRVLVYAISRVNLISLPFCITTININILKADNTTKWWSTKLYKIEHHALHAYPD